MTNEPSYNRTYEPLKFLGRLFLVPLTAAPKTPPVSRTHTWEDTGEHWGPTIVVRVPLTRFALGVGVWLDAPPVVPIHAEDAEFDAYVVVNGQVDREQWRQARQEIADLGLDPDEEWAILQQRGLHE